MGRGLLWHPATVMARAGWFDCGAFSMWLWGGCDDESRGIPAGGDGFWIPPGGGGEPSTGLRMVLRRARDEREVGGCPAGLTTILRRAQDARGVFSATVRWPSTGLRTNGLGVGCGRFLRYWDFWGHSGTFFGSGGVRRGRVKDARAVGRLGVACGRAPFCGGGSSPGSRRYR